MVGEIGMAMLSYAVFLLYHLLILQVILVFVFFFAIVPAFISEISHISFHIFNFLGVFCLYYVKIVAFIFF